MKKYKLREYNKEKYNTHQAQYRQLVQSEASLIEICEFKLHMFLGTIKEAEHIEDYLRYLLHEVKDKCHTNCKLMHIKHINRDRNRPDLLGLKEDEIYKFSLVNSYSEKEMEKFINLQDAVQYCKSNGYVLEYK